MYADNNGVYSHHKDAYYESELQEEIDHNDKVLDFCITNCLQEVHQLDISEFRPMTNEKVKILKKLEGDFKILAWVNNSIVTTPKLLESFVNGNNNIDEKKDNNNVAIYQSHYMQILEWLVNELQITEENQDSFIKKNIIALLKEKKRLINQKFDIDLSDNHIDMLATFVRRPQIGGYKK